MRLYVITVGLYVRLELLSGCDLVIDSMTRSHPDRFVRYAAVCHYRRFVCMSGTPVRVRSGHRFYDQISPGQQLQTYIQTDGNDIRPHTAQTHNERTSTESSLVTAQNTAREPPEDGHTYGPKRFGTTSL
jgi:hypothetical protein